MIDSEELILVLSAMQEIMNMGMEQTKEVFLTIALLPMVMRVLLPTIRWSMMRDLWQLIWNGHIGEQSWQYRRKSLLKGGLFFLCWF